MEPNPIKWLDNIRSNKYIYANRELDINEKSIAGYTALTGESLIIDDAYKIDSKEPYSFNSHFDLFNINGIYLAPHHDKNFFLCFGNDFYFCLL